VTCRLGIRSSCNLQDKKIKQISLSGVPTSLTPMPISNSCRQNMRNVRAQEKSDKFDTYDRGLFIGM